MTEEQSVERNAGRKKKMLWGVLIVVLFPVVFLASKSVLSEKPQNLGLSEGQLRACPSSPNCVCSEQSDEAHTVEALSYTGTPEEALKRLQQIIAQQPRAEIITAEDGYLHAEFTTQIFRYVDDVECRVDPENQQIHLRSASRTGYSDLGANLARIERIRTAWRQD